MTKKLKKKVKKITLTMAGSLLSIIAVSAIGTRLLTMPKAESDQTLAISAESTNNTYAGEVEIIAGSNDRTSELSEDINIAEDGAILCNSTIQGARDNDLPDGEYIFRVEGKVGTTVETKDYAVELINFREDVRYSLDEGQTAKTISLGDTTKEYKTLIVKYHKNLTIDEGVTVTATNVSNLTYKKGMYLCVMGDLVNNGTISMTARGTYNVTGENVFLWKDKNGNYEYIPANGANGIPASSNKGGRVTGKKGNNGINRGTGSGGQGGLIHNGLGGSTNSWIGSSTGGTSYSGGNGSGGVINTNGPANSVSSTQASANRGGNAYAYNSGGWVDWFAGGGAGITGGNSAYYGNSTSVGTDSTGKNGTGGLLVLYAGNLTNDGKIESNGSNGAGANRSFGSSYGGATGGGGSRSEAQ